MSRQEFLMKLSMLEQQSAQIEKQLTLIEQQLNELQLLKLSLGKIQKNKQSEMFAEVGKGVFVQTKLASKDFIVDVGNKIFIKKNLKQIERVIEDQLKKIEQAKKELHKQVEKINKEVEETVNQAKAEEETKEQKQITEKKEKPEDKKKEKIIK